jgi:hypothetical protein
VHTLLNLIFQTGIPTKTPRPMVPELDCKSTLLTDSHPLFHYKVYGHILTVISEYNNTDLTQITFELYERQLSSTEKEHSLRIGFSPGAHYDSVLDLQMDAEHCLKTAPRR